MSMQKKLEKARQEGYLAGLKAGAAAEQIRESFLEGIKVGADAANQVWESAIKNTPGVGPKTVDKINEQAAKEHMERKAERAKLESAKITIKVG